MHMTQETGIAAWALAHFGEAKLGDARRTKRAVQVAAALMEMPGSSLPKATGELAPMKGAYNLLGNPHVDHDDLLSGHIPRTVESCMKEQAILVPQDTTTLTYDGKTRKGLGPVNDSENARGFFAHTALAVSKSTHEVLGVLDQQVYVRSDKRKPKNETAKQRKRRSRESEHWPEGQRRVARAMENAVGPKPKLIFVYDREGDIFEAFEECDRQKQSFVIRAMRNRLLENEEDEQGRRYLLDEVLKAPVMAHTTAQVHAKKDQPARTAQLEVRALKATIRPPRNRNRKGLSLEINIVLAIETQPPEGVEGLCWYLVTREPIETAADVLEVVRIYQARWLIEEFHMGLKSGCAVEERQLETAHSLMNFLAFASVIACHLLSLRDLARRPEQTLAANVLRPSLLMTLSALKPRSLSPTPTTREALRVIAKLGGFVGRKSDGEPGWRTLWRGFERLLCAEAGFLAGRRASSPLPN